MSVTPPRILFVIDALTVGGAQRSLIGVATAAAERGAEVGIVTFRSVCPLPPQLQPDPRIALYSLDVPVQSSPLPLKPLRTLELIVKLRRFIESYRPSCLVGFLEEVNLVTLMALPSMRPSTRVVVSERSYPGFSFTKKGDLFGVARFLGHALRRYLYPRADSVITLTERGAQFLRSEGLSHTTVIPNPVFSPPPASSDIREEQVIVAIGRLAPEKRFDVLIEAFDLLAPHAPGWRLTIYGEGPLRSALTRQISRSNARDRIVLMGPTESPHTVLSSRPIFALSSDVEGFPVALTEAMASGCAVVATDCLTGPRELITHGESGLLVPRRDPEALAAALGTLLTSEVTRRRLGENARRITERYPPPMIFARWWEELTTSTGA